MTVSSTAYLKSIYDTTRSMGDKAVSSDAALEIQGFEGMWLLTKQFPWPQLTPGDTIEIPGPVGINTAQPSQIKILQEGPITFFETTAGHFNNMMLNLIRQGGRFQGKVYEGTPDSYSAVKPIYDCVIIVDNPDRDWENRTQVLTVTGTIKFHYFGETLPGNTP